MQLRVTRTRLSMIASVLVLVAGCASKPQSSSSAVCPPSRFAQTKTLVIAHASSTELGPANTIQMMRSAVDAGADVVDVDVRLTADGILVAAHDDLITDVIGGTTVSIANSTLAELRKVDVGSNWVSLERTTPLRSQRVNIPTVEEVLVAFPDRLTSLEFKVTGGEQTLCDLLRRLDRTGSVYVGSAGDAAVDTFAPLCPEVATTVTDAMVPIMQAARASGTPWCSPVPIGQPPYRAGRIDAESVRWNHDRGLAVFTWTIDDPATLRELAVAGVDAVYTGRADLARQIFDEVAS
jgi:glycerophosphoryl diester phosphodiesterase